MFVVFDFMNRNGRARIMIHFYVSKLIFLAQIINYSYSRYFHILILPEKIRLNDLVTSLLHYGQNKLIINNVFFLDPPLI